MSETAYITTPIYYPSGRPHLGSAYTSVAADVYARFKRLDGFDTRFLTGTDEHGLKLQRAAEKEGKTPQQYVDEMSTQFRRLTEIMNLSNDDFIRTTEERHKKTAQAMWKRLQENGFIYKSSYSGWYCVSDEAYYSESEMVTDAEGIRRSPVSGHPLEWLEEESYFFKLSAFGDRLLDLYERHPELVRPDSRRNEVLGFVKQGLQDISISRTTFNWGVPVPGDPDHVMYVWVDALTNYLSALGWPDGKDMRYWPAVHLVGKDILRFHAVYWPAMLLGAGFSEEEMPRIFAHGWWTVEGEKMSKSKGNVVDPEETVAEFGRDQLRYFLLREVPFGNDGDFSRDHLIRRINTELANDLGNLFQRVLSMVNKHCYATVPPLREMSAEDYTFWQVCQDMLPKVRAAVNALAFHEALGHIWDVVGAANRYMDLRRPWELRKENQDEMGHVLRVLMEAFAHLAVVLEPFMPEAAHKFQQQVDFTGRGFTDLAAHSDALLTTGQPLPAPSGVFPRVEAKTEAA